MSAEPPITPGAEGLLPASTALAEASPESLSELMSISPEWEDKFKASLPRIVEALHEMRRRFAMSETEKASRPAGRTPKATKTLPEVLKTIPSASSVDIDF